MGEPVRKKKRYVALEAHGIERVTPLDMFELVAHMIKEIFGDYGLAEAELSWVRMVDKNNVAVIRCGKDQVEKVRFATLFIKKIGDMKMGLRVVRISGTVKGAIGKR
jgi:RNase P/RNase MRP subunit POP5